VRKSRVITALAAVVLAALTGVLVLQYTRDAEDRAESDLDLVEVLVASRDIPAGTSGDVVLADYTERKEFTRESRPPTSIAPEEGATIEAHFAAAVIPAGQPLSPELFVESAGFQGSVLGVEEGKQAISINVDETHGVAGFVTPGDLVNVLATVDVKNIGASSGDTARTTAFLMPGIKVLAVGQTTGVPAPDSQPRSDTNGDGEINDDDSTATTPEQLGLITLEVTPRQAEQIAHATSMGTIYLSLNPAGVDDVSFENPEEIVEAVNLFDQAMPKVDEVLAAMAAANAQG
jgi:pilus assembly protein CpaB